MAFSFIVFLVAISVIAVCSAKPANPYAKCAYTNNKEVIQNLSKCRGSCHGYRPAVLLKTDNWFEWIYLFCSVSTSHPTTPFMQESIRHMPTIVA